MLNPYEPPQCVNATVDEGPSWLLISSLSLFCILPLGYCCYELFPDFYAIYFDQSMIPAIARGPGYLGNYVALPLVMVLLCAHLRFLRSRGQHAARGLMYFYFGLSGLVLITLGEGLGHWLGIVQSRPDAVPNPDFSYAWFLFGAMVFFALFAGLAYGHRRVWQHYQRTLSESMQ